VHALQLGNALFKYASVEGNSRGGWHSMDAPSRSPTLLAPFQVQLPQQLGLLPSLLQPLQWNVCLYKQLRQ